LRTNAPLDQTTELVSFKVRLLSVATGCFTAIAGSLVFGPAFLIYPIFLVAGAIIQARWRSLGRGLMLSGALLLSAVATFCAAAILEGVRTLRRYHDLNVLVVLSVMLVSVLLVCWCDMELVISEVKIRRAQRSENSLSS
jgi:hypothetical protein